MTPEEYQQIKQRLAKIQTELTTLGERQRVLEEEYARKRDECLANDISLDNIEAKIQGEKAKVTGLEHELEMKFYELEELMK